jgi:hypothetical protein
MTGTGGTLLFTGNNTISIIDMAAPNTIQGTAANTQTISGRMILRSSVGNVITFNSSTGGSPATFNSSFYMHQFNWLSVQDITVGGTGHWYAGDNSTFVSGNSGWKTAPGTAPRSPGKIF